MRPKRVPRAIPAPEKLIHQAIVEALHVLCCVPWWHTPNEGERSAEYAYHLKRMGVKAGVPDLMFLLKDQPPAFIEVKTDKGKLSLAQKAFRDSAVASGCKYAIALSVTDALRTLQEWGCLKGGVRP